MTWTDRVVCLQLFGHARRKNVEQQRVRLRALLVEVPRQHNDQNASEKLHKQKITANIDHSLHRTRVLSDPSRPLALDEIERTRCSAKNQKRKDGPSDLRRQHNSYHQGGDEVIVRSAGRPGVKKRVDEQKTRNQCDEGPVQHSVSALEPGEVVKSGEQNPSSEMQEEEEAVRLINQRRQGSSNVGDRIEQAYCVE